MINVLPLDSKEKIKEYFDKGTFDFNDNSGCVVATNRDEVLGYCTYYLFGDCIKIAQIYPLDDLSLADGVLRSALHIADFRGITNAFYMEKSDTIVFDRLNFIKDKQERSLKIEKLHESCCGC